MSDTNEPGEMIQPIPADAMPPAIPRRPGRPPKSVVDNTNTNYIPSPERNNLDQAVQPAVGGPAGFGDQDYFEGVDLTEDGDGDWVQVKVSGHLATLVAKEHDSPPPIQAAQPGEKYFPVRLKRNYRPVTEQWFPLLNTGKAGKRPKLEDGVGHKVMAGYTILLPMSEAKQVISRGLGERADALPS